MSRTMISLSAAALAVLLPMSQAGNGDADDTRGAQSSTPYRGGGWDFNGPDLIGMVEEDNRFYRGGWDGNGPDLSGMADDGRTVYRGGWDRNGPDAAGGAASDVGRLTLQAIELPDGQVIGSVTN